MVETDAAAMKDINSRVKEIWEQINSKMSPKISTSCSSIMPSKPSSSLSNNWMMYLGLVTNDKESSSQKEANESLSATSDEDKKIVDMWNEMNKKNPKKILKIPSKQLSTLNKAPSKHDNWKAYLGMEKERKSSDHDSLQMQSFGDDNMNDAARKLAAAALASVAAAAETAAAASSKGKIEIMEVRDFAGQEIEYRKLVDAESKEAAEKGKGTSASAVDAVLEQIKKKPKLSVLDKTRKDWGEFKEENKGLEEELDAYKKSTNQYLDKVSFLQRADYREFERERDARVALHAKRKQDTQEDP